MSAARRLVAALAVAVATTAAAHGTATSITEPPVAPLGPDPVTVVIDVEHSRFAPSEVAVVEGTEVTFVVVNGDPINHELIVGPPEVHDEHRVGTHAQHPPVPGEVSVPALSRAVTTYRFDEPGTVEFACHLPGHYDHGMRGEVEVVVEWIAR
jgi:uncharacterized cupredoxin-like copper-binding protein